MSAVQPVRADPPAGGLSGRRDRAAEAHGEIPVAGGAQVRRRRQRKLQVCLSRCQAPPPRLLGRLPEVAARWESPSFPVINRRLSLERINDTALTHK